MHESRTIWTVAASGLEARTQRRRVVSTPYEYVRGERQDGGETSKPYRIEFEKRRARFGYWRPECLTFAQILESFGCSDKSAEKHCLLIYCERKIMFQLKKQAEKNGL
jgi:hypothetical protein